MSERSSEEEQFRFPFHKDFTGVLYELGELTANGTALYFAIENPPNKGDWPTCIEVDRNDKIVWSNLEK